MRDLFSARVKDLLAQRAGYRCSFPNCGALTIGPHTESEKVVNTGVAAHITAASPGGPRYDASRTPEQRASSHNGIWLCGTHAHLVDTDVIRFTTARLQQYRSDHELRVRLEQSGLARPPSMVTEIEVVNQARLRDVRLELSKATWVLGCNSSGKTTLAHAVAGLFDRTFEEWIRARRSCSSSRVSISMFTSDTHRYSIELKDDDVRFRLDGVESPRIPLPVHILFLQDRFGSPGIQPQRVSSGDFMTDYALHFGLTPGDLSCILEHVRAGPRYFMEDVAARDGHVFARDSRGEWRYEALSGSQRALVDTEILFRLATYHSTLAPTFVLLEHVPSYLDERRLAEFASTISQRSLPFQTLVLMVQRPRLPDFGEARVYEFVAQGGGAYGVLEHERAGAGSVGDGQ